MESTFAFFPFLFVYTLLENQYMSQSAMSIVVCNIDVFYTTVTIYVSQGYLVSPALPLPLSSMYHHRATCLRILQSTIL